jgi:DNA-binding LytR/AlgR family response regulator
MSDPFLAIISGDRIAIRHGTATHLVRADDIRAARSQGNYTIIATRLGELKVRAPIATVVMELERFGVMRIHRRGAARLDCVRCIEGRGRHRLIIVLDDGSEMDVGRAYQPRIRSMVARVSAEGSTP